jgi:hypothetical protein
MQSSLPGQRGQGELHVQLIYKPYEDEEDEADNMYKQAEVYALARQEQTITDVRSAAGACTFPTHHHLGAEVACTLKRTGLSLVDCASY